MLLIALILLSVFQTLQASLNDDPKLFGFGINRLKRNKNHLLNAEADDCSPVEEFYYTDAIIDNFAPIEKQQKWIGKGQRYWINKELYGGEGSPIFIFIGGEGEESCRRLKPRLFMYDLALEHNAFLVDIEHRFYGESYPTESMTTDELTFLTSDQALADLARLITYIKETYNLQSSPVITFGGSYPGNLAAWFRLKYPSISFGSVASSAPLTAKENFYEYMEVVNQALLYFSGPQCSEALTAAAENVYALASNQVGLGKLEKDFKTCTPIFNDQDLAIFYSDLMGNLQGTVQYNNEISGVMNVTDVCSIMTDTSNGSSQYDRFVQLTSAFRVQNGQKCEDVSWNATVHYIADTSRNPSNAFRPWLYQTCNEFGYFQTTDSKKQPFYSWSLLNVDFYKQLCASAFDGWASSPQIDFTNDKYGSIAIAGTNIIFPAGTIDPWHALGVTNSTAKDLGNPTERPEFILGTSHCKDMYSADSSDPPELTAARDDIARAVANWIKRG